MLVRPVPLPGEAAFSITAETGRVGKMLAYKSMLFDFWSLPRHRATETACGSEERWYTGSLPSSACCEEGQMAEHFLSLSVARQRLRSGTSQIAREISKVS